MNISTSTKINSKRIKTGLLCLILALLPFIKGVAQPIPVGSILDDQYRLLQLLSDSTIQTSLMNRTIWYSTYNNLFKNNNFDRSSWWGQRYQPPEATFTLYNYDLQVGAYEPVFTNTYNTYLPYGQNNGAAWYGRGLTSELQGGFYVASDYFTLTFRPHLFYSQNKDFLYPSRIPRYPNGDFRYVYRSGLPTYDLADRIDLPFRFGPDPYTTFDWGQSSVRFHYKSIEIGLSNETLWWGPGVRYGLLLSNNAAGFAHIFIGTRKPISLPLNIGKLEFRWLLGRPQDSPYFDLNINDPSLTAKAREKRLNALNSTRIINGLNIVYTPSFLPNLSLGVSRMIHQYVPEGGLSFNEDILAIFKPFPKPGPEVLEDKRVDSFFEEVNPMASVFFRWVFPDANAEFYGEFYKSDHNVNLRDFLMEPQHGRGYTLGVQKLIEFNGFIDFVKVNAEINSLEPGPIDELRPQSYLYTHSTVKQGHTNRGQLLGAGIEPGSLSQFLGVTGYFNKGKVGLFIQRLVRNQHLYFERQDRYFPLGGFKNQFHHNIDLNVGITGTYKLGPVLINGKFTWNRKFNYGSFDPIYPLFYTLPVFIVDNYQLQLSVRYLF